MEVDCEQWLVDFGGVVLYLLGFVIVGGVDYYVVMVGCLVFFVIYEVDCCQCEIYWYLVCLVLVLFVVIGQDYIVVCIYCYYVFIGQCCCQYYGVFGMGIGYGGVQWYWCYVLCVVTVGCQCRLCQQCYVQLFFD